MYLYLLLCLLIFIIYFIMYFHYRPLFEITILVSILSDLILHIKLDEYVIFPAFFRLYVMTTNYNRKNAAISRTRERKIG